MHPRLSHTAKRLRKPAVLALAAVTLAGFAACSADDPSSQTSEPGATGGATAAAGPAEFVLNGWPLPNWLDLPPISQITTVSDPEGNPASYYDAMPVSQAEVDQIRAKRLRVAHLNWDDVPYNKAFDYGVDRVIKELGMELVARTNFDFDAVKAASDVETVLALNPDILISGVLDTSQWPAILRPAIERGVKIVMWSQGGDGLKTGPGEALCTIISYDPPSMGYTVADGIHEKYPDGANVGMIWWNTVHPIVNGRDDGFRERLAQYPNLNLVADMQMDDPNKADEVTQALLARHPEVNVIYGPWDSPPAEGILSALKAAGRTDVTIATMDLGDTSAYEINKGTQIFHSSGAGVYEAGRTMAIAGAKCALGGQSA
ncbi:MAG: substrate-binding domain-containing protein, partial [Propionibacteriaceae bacterium]|nr:substrate-binding domain-containing protein [Propionibacteriaceae bacterium]